MLSTTTTSAVDARRSRPPAPPAGGRSAGARRGRCGRRAGRRSSAMPQVVEVAAGELVGEPRVTRETTSMRVLHVAPTAFGHDGLFGGGERYPLELAGPWRPRASTASWSPSAATPAARRGAAAVQVCARAPPRRPPPTRAPRAGVCDGADVVHTHHPAAEPSRLAAWLQPRVVTTDHGLGADWRGPAPACSTASCRCPQYSASAALRPARPGWSTAGPTPSGSARPRRRPEGVLFVGR